MFCLNFTDHFYTVFNQFTSIFLKRHPSCVSNDYSENLIFMVILAVIKHRTQHKYAKLSFIQVKEILNYDLSRVVNKSWMTPFKHSLDNPTTILMDTKIKNVGFNLLNESLHCKGVCLLAHFRNNFLHDMIAVEIKTTVLYRLFFQ